MALDQECQRKVVKKSSLEEDKKEEKSFLHNKIGRLRKRSEFLDLRKSCLTFHGKTVISNYQDSKNQTTKTGLTVTKKIGSAVQRNRIKRILRAILEKNKNLLRKPIYFELIAKKEIIKCKYEVIEEDIKDILIKIS